MPHLYIYVGSVGDLEDQSKLAFAKNYSNPPTGFNNKKFQEPKRHSSEKIVRNREEQQQQASTFGDEQDQMQSFPPSSHFFQPQVYHASGVSTPPQGYPYYIYQQQPYQYPQDERHHSSENCIPRGLYQNFQNMYLEDPNSQITSMAPQQYVTGYYPMYMNYPQMPANLPQIGRQPQPRISKWSPRKPSTFRPQGDSEQNEHNAVNEQDILFLIKEYEDKNNNFNVLVGRIVGLAVTQTGSRFLQKQLTKSNPDFVTFVLKEVYKLKQKIYRLKTNCLT